MLHADPGTPQLPAAPSAELTKAGHHAESAQLDVTDRDSVKAFVAVATRPPRARRRPFHNAGVMPLSLMEELRVDE
ncbi:hypothetical protein [Streptomyces sp. NBC_00322]|uniref:hypothetical protein n=1 Tax=Streptomyces sp. NBC_00322 TaxID=2975712 RepID=UPI003FA75BBA